LTGNAAVVHNEPTVPCLGCGRPSVVITIRAAARFTVSRCPDCERRAWTINGVDATLAEVLEFVTREGSEGSLLFGGRGGLAL
jgi:hypothetical protein